MIRRAALAALFLAVSCLLSCTRDASRQAIALGDEVQRLAREQSYWPGFDPAAVPLAIFDGERTCLIRHPAPPEGFVEKAGTYVWQGRHPSVVANTSALIGGVPTATVMIPSFPDTSSLRERAAVVIHETFHVFQATTGRRWGANEVDLFLYPVDDPNLLAFRRLETEALRRALRAGDREDAAAWVRVALDVRKERFETMEPSFPAYERGIELLEGTAVYVQYRAAGEPPPDFPAGGFAADDVRNRAYWTGDALAMLLDRFSPDWKIGFGGDDSRFLDTDLAAALESYDDLPARSFSYLDRAEALRRARADVDEMLVRRSAERQRFLSRPGWRLVFEAADGSPIWPQGFDPLNVKRVDGGILHTRFLKLGNEAGTIEVMGGAILTEGIGPHPLFNGIKRAIVTGLSDEPQIKTDAGRVEVTAPPCSAELAGATVSESDSTVVIKLAGATTEEKEAKEERAD